MPRRITVDVYEAMGPTTHIANRGTLGSDTGREWLDDLADVGSGRLQIKVGHADEALILPKRIVRFNLDGSPCWWGVVEGHPKVALDPENREAGRVIDVSIVGALAPLDFVRVEPELGIGRQGPETRNMHFASFDYDDAAWTPAVQLKRYDDPDVTKPWRVTDPDGPAPAGFPDPLAYWIWRAGGDVPPEDPGSIYFRDAFTVPFGEGGEYRVSITADDGFVPFVDGMQYEGEQAAGLWGETRYFDVLLDAGSHLFAAEGINFDRPNPATNGAAIIYSIAKLLDGGGKLGTVVARSDSSTKMLAYPASPPGMTAGKLLVTLIFEAWDRDTMAPYDFDFDEFVDSAGVPWAEELDLALPVGSSYLELLDRLVAEHACEFTVDRTRDDWLTIQAWQTKGTDKTATVAFTEADNIGLLRNDRSPLGDNKVLFRPASGSWFTMQQTPALDGWGWREGFLELGSAPSGGGGRRLVAAHLRDTAYAKELVEDLQIEAVPGGPAPYVDFENGDIVTAPAYDGTPSPFRVVALAVTEDEAGNPSFTPELEEET